MTAALDYVEDILDAAEKIDRYTAGMILTSSSGTTWPSTPYSETSK